MPSFIARGLEVAVAELITNFAWLGGVILSPFVLYGAVRIASTAYFHSKTQFLREFTDGIQREKEV